MVRRIVLTNHLLKARTVGNPQLVGAKEGQLERVSKPRRKIKARLAMDLQNALIQHVDG